MDNSRLSSARSGRKCYHSTTDGPAMLKDFQVPRFTPEDQQLFDQFVRRDHYLRLALETIDWERLRQQVAGFYSPDLGCPAKEPLMMLQFEFLQYHHNLSDRQVFGQAETDLAFRFFLGLGRDDTLPNPSTLSYFRGRLGVEGHQKTFDDLVAQAREQGMIRDRLRLKDATHVIANVAVPATLGLIAETRDKLLAAAEPFDPVRVEGERARAEMLRQSTQGQSNEERLAGRITHLEEILAWAELLEAPDDEPPATWKKLHEIRQLARKILGDREPKAGDKTLSTIEPDARRGKHGDWYDGFLMDVCMDADSEFFTSINVLPANGDEAADAAELIRREEAAQGNDVEALSIDGIGFNGPVLRKLQDEDGLDLEVFVPPSKEPETELFTPQDFAEDEAGHVTCPAGQTSSSHQRDNPRGTTIHRFDVETCRGCPLVGQCMSKPPNKLGRTVRKTDYAAEYKAARAKATTPEYEAVRSEHPAVERKLSEMVNRHGCRKARSRGQPKMLMQALTTGIVVNVKRFVLLAAPMWSGFSN